MCLSFQTTKKCTVKSILTKSPIQVIFTKNSYIQTLFLVRFIQDSVLFRVWFIQDSVLSLIQGTVYTGFSLIQGTV